MATGHADGSIFPHLDKFFPSGLQKNQGASIRMLRCVFSFLLSDCSTSKDDLSLGEPVAMPSLALPHLGRLPVDAGLPDHTDHFLSCIMPSPHMKQVC